MSTTSSTLWVAYGAEGNVVGTVRHGRRLHRDDRWRRRSLGTYPTMEIAKSALHGHLPPGSDWPRFQEH
jgi:hypothetical protein